jgi:hypothetical protein
LKTSAGKKKQEWLAAANLRDLAVAAFEQRGVERFARATFSELAGTVGPALTPVVAQKWESHWVFATAALNRLTDLG